MSGAPVDVLAVMVEGQPRVEFQTIDEALNHAKRAVYLSAERAPDMERLLASGQVAEWSYGFASVSIVPVVASGPLSSRLRPGVECAPWVIGEVVKLEADAREARAAVAELADAARGARAKLEECDSTIAYFDADAEMDALDRALARFPAPAAHAIDCDLDEDCTCGASRSDAPDPAAVAELVAAVRERRAMSAAFGKSTGPFADSDARIDAALAKFPS